ncbi:Bifunctional penicillin-binding protein 1A/1B ponA1 : penicillin-insensitive transglycosylase + penicillin-sensitive transpeptidase [Mycolicibacterium smegmatis MC2 155]|nr:Bifunctional penicillin-binding protein 1A/1B ponA1 : penicillin-insensitive transglycosylase + penicillin-sensitive transpeptidase [Mycolicibacterium smegmatis MC2 155]
MMVLLPLITFGMAYMIVDVPEPGDIRTPQVSTILASDGSEIARIVPPEGNRVDVKIDQIPVHVRDAVMAAEDRDFYSNPGFSWTGFLRAIKNNLFGGGGLQGGSTITQQYVKNALVGDERSGIGGLIRKAKELVISTKMSGEWSKDAVLQAYLNIIYFGRGAYGISAASKAYFDKPVEQLDVAEGALLAALIQRPSTLDPAVDPEGAADRWNWVLDGMVDIGALSQADRDAQVFPPTVPPDYAFQQNQTTGPNGLIERQVTNELLDLFDINEQTLNTEGLQITTTIDPKAQEAAVDAVDKYLEGQDPDMRAAVVSIDPRTGGIKAYYGGSDANGFDFAQAGLPTGSSFKVFALVAALQQGIGLGYQIDSGPLEVNGIKIGNVEGEGCGTCSIAEALKRSLNTSYYRLMLKLENGPADVAEAAHDAGVAESFPGVEHTLSEDGKGGPPNNGVVLGQYQSRVLDMASAYATLAASGVYHKPHFVEKVVNSSGQVLFDASKEDNGEERIDKAVADNVTSAMQPIAGWSRGHNLAGGRPSAAKTGTVQLGDTGDNRDAWMVGYTPSLSTAVWVGTTEGVKPLVNKWGSPIYGSGLPSDIWKATMDGALEGTDVESFPKPTEIGGYAGVPQAPAAPPPSAGPPTDPGQPSVTVIQPTIEVAPGITIPIGPPTTVPVGPPPGAPGAPVGPGAPEVPVAPGAPGVPGAPPPP